MDLAWCLPGAFVLGFSVAGCGLGGIEVIANGYNCADPDEGFIDPASGIPDPCHERTPWPDAGAADAEAGDPSCAGVCVPTSEGGFDTRTYLTWIGPIGTAPECPDNAPTASESGFTDLEKPPKCGACTCEAPTGSCGLPDTITANAATCLDVTPSTPRLSFDPPMGWNGTCSTDNPLPATMCPGPDCIQSLTFGKLTVNEVAQCAPVAIDPPRVGDAYYKKEARLCARASPPPCANGYECAPSPPSEWRLCIFSDSLDNHCPAEVYTEDYVFYRDPPDDNRNCNPCTCGAPAGSECHGCISVYQDKTCTAARGCPEVSSTMEACHDIFPPGKALFSKKADTPTYTPGTCQPMGGEEIGDVVEGRPIRVCCTAPAP